MLQRDGTLARMTFEPPPAVACWQHVGLRTGFEVVRFEPSAVGLRVEGTSTGLEEDEAWAVSYRIELDDRWRTRSARIGPASPAGQLEERRLESDGEGHWTVDGVRADHLDGCMDVDLEASAMTNAFPVHRLDLAVGERTDAPASYVRLAGTSVERLAQVYIRVEDAGSGPSYDYESPAFDFRCRLVYDDTGLVLEYPGIAQRAF
jgi:hypothetical protein